MTTERLGRHEPPADCASWREWAATQGSCLAMGGRTPGIEWSQWAGTSPVMRQPRLDCHVLVRHEGGHKRVNRFSGTRRIEFEPAPSAFTFIPAETVAEWRTLGPIAFSHFYIEPEYFAAHYDIAPSLDDASDDILGRADPVLSFAADRILCTAPDDPLLGDAHCDLLMSRLRALLSGAHPEDDGFALSPTALKRTIDLMIEAMDTPLTLDRLAEEAGMSRFHFARAFKRQTGQSPYAFLSERRMQRALSLLRNNDLSIADIGKACGYPRPTHFSSRFNAYWGQSPQAWRNSKGRA